MTQIKQISDLSVKFFSATIIIAYLFIGFIPNLGAVDKIAPQWLGLSLLNLVSTSLILFYSTYYNLKIFKVIKSGVTIIYIAFFLWASLSYFYAINKTEVIINLARQANTIFMYLHLSIFVQMNKNIISWVGWIMVLILSIEVYAIITEAYQMSQSLAGIDPGKLKGVTANRNIGAFSIAIKIPFALFILHITKNRILKLYLFGLIFFSLLGLSLVSSRAAYVAVMLIVILHSGYIIFQYYQNRELRNLIPIVNIIMPLILAVFFNQLILSNEKTDNAIERASTISLSTNDGSVNQRLRYYKDVLSHMSLNPILVTGLGNWKLVSIDYDKEDIIGYVVPYHAHSDFIQLGAELGIIGFLLYLGIFLFAAFGVFKILRSTFISKKEKTFVFFLFISLGVYFIDANLNFPIARPQVLAPWAIIMALISFYSIRSERNDNTKAISKNLSSFTFIFFGLIIIAPTIFVSNAVYKSLKAQMTILQDFNSNKYSIPLNQIENFIPSLPNITVTTIPMDAIKARYYFHYKKYDKALKHLEMSKEQNPYLMYTELLLSQVNLAKGNILESKKYAKKAFFNLPNNNLHASHYLQLLIETGDKIAFNETFDALTKNNNINSWKNYLVGASKLFPPGDTIQMERSLKATKIFSGNNEFIQLHKLISIGTKKINEGLDHSNSALSYFNKGEHDKAVIEFEKAIESDPLEFSYRENAATSYYLLNDLNKAVKHIDIVINKMNPLNGKCEYIKALIYLKFGDPIGACPLLQTSKDSGYAEAENTFNRYCSKL